MTDIDGIHRELELASFGTGDIAPVVAWIGKDGDSCPPDAALACVVFHGGKYWTVDLSDFDGEPQ